MPGSSDDPSAGSTQQLDLRGLLCPLPVIRAARAAAAASPGELLELLCTDPGVREDLPIWCRMHGHSVESIAEDQDALVVRIRIGAPAPPGTVD